jgi:hypothetical protein
MRERAKKIEELKMQVKTYEELCLHISRDEEDAQQSSSSSRLPANKRGAEGLCPPQQTTQPLAASEERCHVSFPNDSQFGYVQQQVCPAPVEQQPVNISRPAALRTPAPSLLMEDGIMSSGGGGGGILPLSTADLSAEAYEDFAFDMAELVNKSAQSTSLLHMAVAGNHVDTIKVLLQDERIKIDDVDGDGFTPLQQAVMHGRTEIVKLLLEHSTISGFKMNKTSQIA